MPIEIIISLIAALGVGGILGALLNRRFEKQKQINEHDIRIFNQSNEILTEQKLSDVAKFHLLGNHSIVADDFVLLTDWCRFFVQAGNQYLDKRIIKENQKLLEELDQLTDFIAMNFFTLRDQNPDNKNRYLKPDWNPDWDYDTGSENVARYQEYASELKDMTRKVMKQYPEYRLMVKRSLKI